MSSKIRKGRSTVSPAVISFALAALSIAFFTRVVPEAFDLPKVVLILIGGTLIVTFAIARSAKGYFREQDVRNGVPFAWGIVALVISAMRNPSGQLAWIGQEHRYTGALFWIVCMAIAGIAYFSEEKNLEVKLAKVVSLAAVPFFGYSVLQALSLDPYDWNTETFGSNYIFSTQGNPNFASWTTSLFFGLSQVLAFEQTSRKWKYAAAGISGLSVFVAIRTVSVQGLLGILLITALWLVSSVKKGFRDGEWGQSLRFFVIGLLLAVGLFTEDTIWLITVSTLIASLMLVGHRVKVHLPRVYVVAFAASVSAGIAILMGLKWSAIEDWIGSQAGERTAFYRAAFGMIGDSPLVGHGFDRYGRIFTQYRPSWHADELSNSISGSAHSIWFGLFVSGGLLLLLPLFLLAARAISISARQIFAREIDEQVRGFSIVVIVLLLLWTISVEQASVILVTLIVLGVTLRSARGERTVKKGPMLARVGVVMAGLLFLFVSTLSVRWLVGNKAQGDSYRELFGGGDLSRGLSLLDRAADWGPQRSEVLAVRSNVYAQLGENQIAIQDAIWVSDEYNYSGYGSLENAQLLIDLGEKEAAIRVIRRTIENNSNNRALVEMASALLESLGTTLG